MYMSNVQWFGYGTNTNMYQRERERGKKCYDVEIVCIVFGMGMTKSWHTAHQKGTYIFDEIIWKTNLLRVFDCGITPFSNSRFVAEFTNITRVNFVQQNIYSSIFRSVYYHSQFQMKWFCVQFSSFDGNFIVFVHILRQSFHVYMFLFSLTHWFVTSYFNISLGDGCSVRIYLMLVFMDAFVIKSLMRAKFIVSVLMLVNVDNFDDRLC